MLNARYHEQEAYIIAQAGAPGAVTIATNMAGRGTDIQLGGNVDMRIRQELEGIADPARARAQDARRSAPRCRNLKQIALDGGGLFVIGTERHESRRIDNQLRGRSGRQGDPGASRFFLSLEDDLMRIFGTERMDTMLKRLGLKEDEAITHSWVTKALEKAQQKVEARNFEIRKNLLKYDDVMNDQRKVIYEQRHDLMQTPDVSETVTTMRHEVIDDLMAKYIPGNSYPEQWDTKGLHEEMLRLLNIDLPIPEWAKEEGIDDDAILERLTKASDEKMAEKERRFGPEIMRMVEKSLLLQILDQHWKEHLQALDYLRQGIGLRGYAPRDVLSEYKREAFEMFEGMLNRLRETVSTVLSHVEVRVQRPEDLPAQPPQRVRASHPNPPSLLGGGPGPVAVPPASAAARTPQLGRGAIDPKVGGEGAVRAHAHLAREHQQPLGSADLDLVGVRRRAAGERPEDCGIVS